VWECGVHVSAAAVLAPIAFSQEADVTRHAITLETCDHELADTFGTQYAVHVLEHRLQLWYQ